VLVVKVPVLDVAGSQFLVADNEKILRVAFFGCLGKVCARGASAFRQKDGGQVG